MQAGPPSKVKSAVVFLGMCCGFPVVSTLSSSLPGPPATVENSGPEIHTAQAKPGQSCKHALQQTQIPVTQGQVLLSFCASVVIRVRFPGLQGRRPLPWRCPFVHFSLDRVCSRPQPLISMVFLFLRQEVTMFVQILMFWGWNHIWGPLMRILLALPYTEAQPRPMSKFLQDI